MKIVQTFWSGGKNLLESDFGWLNPSYHLMSWTLSCLKLKEHYDKIYLYTDTKTYELFNDYLSLPYTKYYKKYDTLKCSPNLWALPKIFTYSRQNEPFIHLDGDVFISKRFADRIDNAQLITQNKEKGTTYYKWMMEALRPQCKFVPEFLQPELNKSSIPSYNLGIFGGQNIQFIKKYCDSALKLIHNNRFDQIDNISINTNILFEQILFHAITKSEDQRVTCLFKEVFNDNGYMYDKMCDFSKLGFQNHYLHIIGGYKRNSTICEMISRHLLKHYPEYYFKIMALFETKKYYLFKMENASAQKPLKFNGLNLKKIVSTVCNSPIKMPQMRNELLICLDQWKCINKKDLFQCESTSIDYFNFLHLTKDKQLKVKLARHPYVYISRKAFNWSSKTKKILQTEITNGALKDECGIAFVPEIFTKGYRTVVIDKLCYNILTLLEEPMNLKALLDKIKRCFNPRNPEYNTDEIVFELLILKLKFLFFNKCLFISINNEVKEP